LLKELLFTEASKAFNYVTAIFSFKTLIAGRLLIWIFHHQEISGSRPNGFYFHPTYLL